jgi:hypothetical protein
MSLFGQESFKLDGVQLARTGVIAAVLSPDPIKYDRTFESEHSGPSPRNQKIRHSLFFYQGHYGLLRNTQMGGEHSSV